jgi:hypothetical protein
MKWTEGHAENVFLSFCLFYMYFYNLQVSSKTKPVHTCTLQLSPLMQHFYREKDLETRGPFMYVQVTIGPDGSISHLRLWGYCHSSI